MFSVEEMHLLCYLSDHDFIYPKILFHCFEDEIMLFQTEQAVFGKAMYQKAFRPVENMLNFGLV